MATPPQDDWQSTFEEAVHQFRLAAPPPDEQSLFESMLVGHLDEGDFWGDITTGDLVGLLLRVHLWVEQALEEILQHVLPQPQHLSNRMSFDHRLRLVLALGLNLGGLEQAFRTLNQMRNSAAHNLDGEPDAKAQAHFVSLLPDGLNVPTGADPIAQFAVALMLVGFGATHLKVDAMRTRPIEVTGLSRERFEEMVTVFLDELAKGPPETSSASALPGSGSTDRDVTGAVVHAAVERTLKRLNEDVEDSDGATAGE